MIVYGMKKLLLLLLFILELFSKELVTPINVIYDYDERKAQLGKKLFHDKRLSSDNSISCSSCHILNNGGDDNREVSIGVKNRLGSVNSPTIFNSRFNFVQFWDGRAKDLTEQAMGPIHNPVEMDSSFPEILEKLKKDKYYIQEFKDIYKEFTKENLLDAIVEFEKALVTPNSKFDKYLMGELDILTKDELEGYTLFKDLGCISCHNGINIGGNLFQKMGVMKEYKSDSLGRYNVTKKDEDKYFFKVPSLRNIARTSPYFHDASKSNLRDAIEVMIEYQVGLIPQEEDIIKIEKFLKTLTGNLPPILVDR